MTDELAVWLHGIRVAVIDLERDRPRLQYTDAALNTYPLGTPLLSLSLPLTSRRYPQGVVRSFLEGLLPEGGSRAKIARDVGVPSDDTYRLIGAIGRECAGAIVIQPAGDPPPPNPTTTMADPLTPKQLDELVSNLSRAPLGVAGDVRLSLAGVQEKLVLTKMPDGRWGRPVDGTPSTHILKPSIADFPNTVENEAFCMRLAKHLGMDVAAIETTEIAGRKLIVVERYDRRVAPDGSVQRLHQEDFCQATGVLPLKKYQEDGGPSLLRMAHILEEVAARDSLERLLKVVTLNALIGNGDAHAKNFSLLYSDIGTVTLAPLYDALSTLCYGDEKLAMYIDKLQRTRKVTIARIVNEAVSWGMGKERAQETISSLLDGAPAAMAAAHLETEGVPADLLLAIEHQLNQLHSET